MLMVSLAVNGKRCLVVGGGGVALRKIETLLQEGARVTVVAADPIEAISLLASRGAIELQERRYEAGEAARYRLVFAATDDPAVNVRVHRDADEAGVWVNVADDPERCSFHMPARIRRESLQISVATDGKAPFVSRRLRQVLERSFGPEWGEWIQAAAGFREKVRGARLSPAQAERCFEVFFARTVDTERMRARVPGLEEELEWLGGGFGTAGRGSMPRKRGAVSGTGFVSLVGAGPGNPLLLTLRGAECVRRADVVVYDRLAARSLPSDLPDGIELHCVGKQPGHHPIPQEEINALLVRLAGQGKRVVRFKGGDPFVFGRGGEEAEALKAAGVPYEVVPGVTAGVAAPAWAGIPVTHRKEAVRLTLLTAHESSGDDRLRMRWDLIARDPNATLVGYMGVTSLPRVVDNLLAEGMDPGTPAAVVERGTTAEQRTVRAPLGRLAEAAVQAGIQPPAVFVVGPTARHGEDMDWYAGRPCHGERIAMVSPAGELGQALIEAGGERVEIPLPLTGATRVVLGAGGLTGCLLRSVAEVDALDEERGRPEWGENVVAWCLGEEVALHAQGRGWTRVRALPKTAKPAAIVEIVGRG
jgi:uroporphyrin-III C-methyltransferase/precorrin-2 dehydrogenase/sirohydrochlorin ferrochelatase